MTRKKLCRHCNKIVDELNHNCSGKEKQRLQYNKYKRNYYQENKETVAELTSRKWRKFRKNILSRDNNMCQRCLIKHGIINGDNLEAHHIKPRVDYPELMYDENNVVTVCKTCNLQLGTSGIDFEWENPEIELKL